jgi:hypothetical protein
MIFNHNLIVGNQSILIQLLRLIQIQTHIAAVPTKKRGRKPLSDKAKAIKDQDKKDKQEKLKQDKQVAKRAKLNKN